MKYRIGSQCRLRVPDWHAPRINGLPHKVYSGTLKQVDLTALTATIWDPHWGPITGSLVDLEVTGNTQETMKTLAQHRQNKCPHYGKRIRFTVEKLGELVGTVIELEDHGYLGHYLKCVIADGPGKFTGFVSEFKILAAKKVGK